MTKLSELLIRLRKKIKISQSNFSKKYRFSIGHICKIEKEKIINPIKKTMKKLNKLLKLNNIK